jgi:hypothetical protein
MLLTIALLAILGLAGGQSPFGKVPKAMVRGAKTVGEVNDWEDFHDRAFNAGVVMPPRFGQVGPADLHPPCRDCNLLSPALISRGRCNGGAV